MITPRLTFRNSPFAKGWQTLVDSAPFQSAVNTALLEMQLRNQNAPDMGNAAARYWHNQGALQFLSILMNLTGTEAKPAKDRMPDNLNPHV